MTILWDLDPRAAETYAFALGERAVLLTHGPQVMRALEEDHRHRVVVIGPDLAIDQACVLAEALRVDRPEVGVLLLRQRLDVGIMGLALRSGVREVLQSDDHTAIAEAVARNEQLAAKLAGDSAGETRGKIITVFSAKGGVGKTTVSTNMAAHLAASGARTLLVDLDLMFGDVAISLQLLPSATVTDLVAMRGHIDRCGLESVAVTHEETGLDVIAPSSDPGEAERVPADVVLELLRTARSAYDYIVVDTPPAFTEHVLTSLDVSDLAVLITTLDIPAVKNLRVAINTLDTLGGSTDNRVVVLNRAGMRVGLDPDEVETALGQSIAVSIPNSLAVPAATNRGTAIVASDPKDAAAVALRELTDRQVRARFGETIETTPARRGLRRRSRV